MSGRKKGFLLSERFGHIDPLHEPQSFEHTGVYDQNSIAIKDGRAQDGGSGAHSDVSCLRRGGTSQRLAGST